MSSAAAQRLSRLLAMVPWLLSRPGVQLDEAARHFKISRQQLVKDLELLFVCGTPGHLPDDLIEAEWDSGRVYLSNADTIAQPLRLAPDEAVALIAGLRTLLDLPDLHGQHDRGTVESALLKITAAAQDAAAAADRVSVDLSDAATQDVLGLAREALQQRRRVQLRYLVPARDEVTERQVDLMRVITIEGRWYLEGWCHRAQDVRLFRLDRVAGATVLAEPGIPPPQARGREQEEALFVPSPADTLVTLRLQPPARWVAEYYPVQETQEEADGSLLVTLAVADTRWVPRLVLRLGGHAQVVEPAGIRQDTQTLAQRALLAYRTN